MTLSELQSNFAKALHYQATGNDCNILDNRLTADERLQIYRNNFIISLTEILHLTYPDVLSLVGEQCFDGLARKHILSCPLLEGNVSGYGGRFSKTIRSVKQVITAVPYLEDVANLEWAIDESSQMNDHPQPIPNLYAFQKIQTLNSDELAKVRLFLNPACKLVESKFAVFSIRNAIKNHDFENLDIHKREGGVVLVLSNDDLLVEKLSVDELMLIKQIESQIPLGLIAPNILLHLQKLISLNLFIGFQMHT
ncbi:HvfC/BufC N-terminal domain-containing protein [Vibrio algarum]|uniref:DNA-binding domain-containing protein n=1 Tax=Vibrio algarum TaxID=3020714 RepID=A0ABT4YM83_9VIBR|nr:DNA-binding domain-containing protein [Vibrio sp. KJ40-1]MDB1122630.1 DNA-binding domain-containing protein [Vibrio sp. KJ40-1]